MSQWRVSDMARALLIALAIMAVWESYVLNRRPETGGCGGDFLQFYTAGSIVARGESARLYDQEYFRELQAPLRDDPQRSLYPPTLALAVAPLGRLSPSAALDVWWVLQIACLAVCATIFFRTTPLPRHWRINMLLGLAALLPMWIAVGIGHLSPMLLLVLTCGLTLHRRGRRLSAGIVLSLLAVKPQLAVGVAMWMLIRRDVRTMLGLAVGGALQFVVVALAPGPGIWLDYVRAMSVIAASLRAYVYSPLFQQSFAGIASNLIDAAGLPGLKIPAMRTVYAVTSAVAALTLCRVVAARRPFGGLSEANGYSARRRRMCRGSRMSFSPVFWPGMGRGMCRRNYEYACGVLMMMMFPPHFLVYDQTLLAIPLVMLWASPAWPWGVLLLAVSAVPLANLSFMLGFSVTGIVGLATMVALARQATQATASKAGWLRSATPRFT